MSDFSPPTRNPEACITGNAAEPVTCGSPRLRRWTVLCWLLLGTGLMTWNSGCVYRRMTIRSDPPGALVLVDGQEVGYTPVSVDFTYYATREITLVKDGFETLTTLQKVPAPWYQVPPLDFISDNFLPYRLTNRHEFSYRLRPQVVVPTQELLDRGNALRSEAHLNP